MARGGSVAAGAKWYWPWKKNHDRHQNGPSSDMLELGTL